MYVRMRLTEGCGSKAQKQHYASLGIESKTLSGLRKLLTIALLILIAAQIVPEENQPVAEF
jgi:hypothetical protein